MAGSHDAAMAGSVCDRSGWRGGLRPRWSDAPIIRQQAEQPQRDCWAAYLRGQADALDLQVVTTSLGIEVVADALAVHVEKIRAERQAAAEQANPADAAARRR